jgi:galactose mutarotase-like enzyme
VTTAIRLESPHLTVELDPDRGGEFRSIIASDSDNLLAWHEWDTPLSADRGPSYGSTQRDWESRYKAGWQVLFPNVGAEATVDGVPLAFHGESSLARLAVLAHSTDACTLRATARLPLELVRTVRLSPNRPALLIEETVTNVGAKSVPFIWGHHPTFPAVPGSKVDLPGRPAVQVEPTSNGLLAAGSGQWPLLNRTDGGLEDLSTIPDEIQVRLAYVTGLNQGWVALRPPTGPGIALAWDLETFPSMWMWLQNADPGFPWYGRARMLGLEPQRSWPFDGLNGARQRGQELTLEPGESTSSWITLSVLAHTHHPVTSVERNGRITTE